MREPLRALRVLVKKELLAEWRSREALSAMFFFAATALLIFNFSLDLAPVDPRDVVPGILWVTLVFAALLGLNRSVAREREQGGQEGMMLAPVPRSALFVAKGFANLLFLLAVQGVALPILVALFNVALPWALLPVLLLGSLGIAAAGTMFAAMAANTRLRDVLLPLLLLPILIPLLIGTVQATGALLHGDGLRDVTSALALIAAFDTIFITLSTLLFEYVLEQ